jgi:hypothetical protein
MILCPNFAGRVTESQRDERVGRDGTVILSSRTSRGIALIYIISERIDFSILG